jgi:predicted RecB family endonuclease
MKTNISIPNPIHEAAEQLAQTLGVSLSDLYTAALTAYVTAHQREEVTEALNRVYEREPSTIEPGLVTIQLASVGGETW